MWSQVLNRWRRRNLKTLKPFRVTGSQSLQLTVGDANPDLAATLAKAFTDADAVEVVSGNLLSTACDAIVSPANSFGNMGGGIDKAIDDFHRGEAQRLVMEEIRQHYFGELPVGMAMVVEIDSSRFPFVVAAPTMRIPGSVQGSINAYLSMRAALVAVLRHNRDAKRRIQTLAVPGLGTGVGGIDYLDAAQQMRAAYDNVIEHRWKQIVIAAQAPYAMR